MGGQAESYGKWSAYTNKCTFSSTQPVCLWLVHLIHLHLRKLLICMRRKWQPTPVFLPRECSGQRSLVGCCPWVAQSQTWLRRLSMHVCIGEGNGNPLQYSCLENPRDGGAWWAAVYAVTQSHDWSDLAAVAAARSYYHFLNCSGFIFCRSFPSCFLPREVPLAFVVQLFAKSLQLCPTLCDPIDSSPPGFPVPGILQARTLEWVAISFSNAWKWKVKWGCSVVSYS